MYSHLHIYVILGYETARALAYHGCEVIFACRSREKATDAMQIIRKERVSFCRCCQINSI